MKRQIASVACAFIAFAAFAAAPTTVPSPAERYDAAFLAGDTQVVWDHASPEMQKVFGTPAKLKAFRDSALGKNPSAGPVTTSTANGFTTLVRTVTAASGRSVDITFAVDPKTKLLVGLLVKPAAPRPAAPPAPAVAARPAPRLTDDQIRAALLTCVDTQRRAPALVVGLIDDQGTRVFAYGKRERGKPDDVTPDTLFQIGSVTKTFTTTLLQEMADRGELKLTDPITELLPPTVTAPSRDGKQITLLHLAAHTSGLPNPPGNAPFADGEDPWADYTTDLLYAFLPTYELPRDIGAQYEYSNVGMSLLGQLLALRAKTDYESLVTQRICAPLQMTSTRITLTPEQLSHAATGHIPSGVPVKPWTFQAIQPAGAIYSSANDMLKYLAANMGKAPASPLTAAMKKTHRPRYAVEPFTQIALGWHVTTLPGRRAGIVWHNGQTGGFHAYLGFDPDARRGVVLLANASNDIDDLGLYFLGAADALPDFTPPPQRTPISLPPSSLDPLAGRYQVSPQVTATITRDGDHLLIAQPGAPRSQLLPESETTFSFTTQDAQATFVKDADGNVTHLVVRADGKEEKLERLK